MTASLFRGQALGEPEPHGYTRTKPPPSPVLGPYHPIIEQILTADEQAPRKQRHTMMQVYRRLAAEHGYTGGYDAVRRYIVARRDEQRPTYIPLDHEPGQRMEADFGHIQVDFPAGRQMVSVLVCTWSYSNAVFAVALPTERTEAVLAGMVQALTFYGGVPRQVWWDNPKTIVVGLGRGRQRTYQERYLALASYYCFEPCSCLPRRPQEKPRVENRVKDLQRRFATPVPAVRDLAELNAHLSRCCLDEHLRRVHGQQQTIGERWAEDLAAAYLLPPRPFEPCVYSEAVVDHGQRVPFDTNRYSVPHQAALRQVTIKATIDEVVVLLAGQTIARHPRCYGRGQQVLDPYHYLPRLHERPGALDRSAVFQHWQLPPAFEQLRAALELRHGALAGKRHYIRVVQLLGEYPLDQVQHSVELHLAHDGVLDAGVLRVELERCACPPAQPLSPDLLGRQVPQPDLRHFDRLLTTSPGGNDHA